MTEIRTPSQIIALAAASGARAAAKKFYKNGVELEKGAIITSQRIERNRALYETIYNYWMCYPDMLVQMLTPTTSNFSLYFYQRLFMRAITRHARICTIAPRALTLLGAL